uniref:Uncharacterized protein n=1 Tax=Setaria italica TaxID=4555 RepID=K3YAF2_SETIT
MEASSSRAANNRDALTKAVGSGCFAETAAQPRATSVVREMTLNPGLPSCGGSTLLLRSSKMSRTAARRSAPARRRNRGSGRAARVCPPPRSPESLALWQRRRRFDGDASDETSRSSAATMYCGLVGAFLLVGTTAALTAEKVRAAQMFRVVKLGLFGPPRRKMSI